MSETSRPLAIVTGASSGIGLELAKLAADQGYDLIIAADEPEIRDAAEALEAEGATVRGVQADLATMEGVNQLYAAARELGRPVEILIANADAVSATPFSTRILRKPGAWSTPTSSARSIWCKRSDAT